MSRVRLARAGVPNTSMGFFTTDFSDSVKVFGFLWPPPPEALLVAVVVVAVVVTLVFEEEEEEEEEEEIWALFANKVSMSLVWEVGESVLALVNGLPTPEDEDDGSG
jgi:hypothetical protein